MTAQIPHEPCMRSLGGGSKWGMGLECRNLTHRTAPSHVPCNAWKARAVPWESGVCDFVVGCSKIFVTRGQVVSLYPRTRPLSISLISIYPRTPCEGEAMQRGVPIIYSPDLQQGNKQNVVPLHF